MRFEEALKNYLKTSDWKYQKSIDSGFDKLKNPVQAREAFDQLSGVGANNLGLAGIIRNAAKSGVGFKPTEKYDELLDTLHSFNNTYQEFDEGVELPAKVISSLAKNLVKYYSSIGTDKDPVYSLIENGAITKNNIEQLGGWTTRNANNEYERLKGLLTSGAEIPNTAAIRAAQGLATPYRSTDLDKKILEEFYDQSNVKAAIFAAKDAKGFVPYDKEYGFLRPNDFGNFQVSDTIVNTPFFGSLELPARISGAIEGGFIPESALRNNRIGLTDLMSRFAKYDANKHIVGFAEWESTKPILNAGEYSWHKVPYNINAQLIEGKKMNNCAGDKCIARPEQKDIYSLRRSETNTPKVNFVHLPWREADPIEQIKGISNSDPKEKYFDAIQQLKQYLGIK